jgi:hypothetical protein
MLHFALHPLGPLYHFGITFLILQFCSRKIYELFRNSIWYIFVEKIENPLSLHT